MEEALADLKLTNEQTIDDKSADQSIDDQSTEDQSTSQPDDPVLELRTSEKCELLHHLIDLSKMIQEKFDNIKLITKNNKLVSLLLSLPVRSPVESDLIAETKEGRRRCFDKRRFSLSFGSVFILFVSISLPLSPIN